MAFDILDDVLPSPPSEPSVSLDMVGTSLASASDLLDIVGTSQPSDLQDMFGTSRTMKRRRFSLAEAPGTAADAGEADLFDMVGLSEPQLVNAHIVRPASMRKESPKHIAQQLDYESCTESQPDSEPLAPTQPDSEATLVDTQPEEDSLERFLEEDTLLHLWQQPPVLLTPHQQDSDSEWDSQLTANENPNEPTAPLHHVLCDDHGESNPSIKHWSLDPNFLNSVNAVLEKMDNELWFNADFLIRSDLTDFDKCFTSAIDFIEARVSGWDRFKIGITENPWLRWHNTSFGYGLEANDWNCMFLLYCSPTSKHNVLVTDSPATKALKLTSTSAMEVQLVEHFREYPECKNTGPGGECPSNGSPHFTYVVCRELRCTKVESTSPGFKFLML